MIFMKMADFISENAEDPVKENQESIHMKQAQRGVYIQNETQRRSRNSQHIPICQLNSKIKLTD